MSEWFYKRFDANIIILIRHPAAFVSSLILLDWYFPFSDLLKQKELLKCHLLSFEDKIRLYDKSKHGLIDEAILAWCLLHHTILKYQKSHKDWVFVRHEDLSRSPEKEFRRIFEKIELEFDSRVKKSLNEYCGIHNPNDTTDIKIPVSSPKAIKRNSLSNIWNWKKRLKPQEIEYIRKRVEPISSMFYSDQDW